MNATLSRLKKLSHCLPSGVTRLSACLGALLGLMVIGALSVQYLRLSHLESKWNAVESKVTELKALQGQVKQFRPWLDSSLTNLQIARTLTEAFPEEGVVWAKRLEIDGSSEVFCTGNAARNQEWMDVLDRLREGNHVDRLQFQRVRGEDPLEFAMSFRWNGGQSHGD